MPIYEYLCEACQRPFEELVFSSSAAVACPLCGGDRVARQMSVFSSSGGSSEREAVAPMASGGGCCARGGCTCH